MKIGVFIIDIEARVGGTESYFAALFEHLQKAYRGAEFTVITGRVKKSARLTPTQLAEKLNAAFGTSIHGGFTLQRSPCQMYGKPGKVSRLRHVFTKLWYRRCTTRFDVCINCSMNMLVSAAKINYAIIHFPSNPYADGRLARRIAFLAPLAMRLDRVYRQSYRRFFCNSGYTAAWLKQKWNIEDERIRVLYPPVMLADNTPPLCAETTTNSARLAHGRRKSDTRACGSIPMPCRAGRKTRHCGCVPA